MHPSLIMFGFETAKTLSLSFQDSLRLKVIMGDVMYIFYIQSIVKIKLFPFHRPPPHLVTSSIFTLSWWAHLPVSTWHFFADTTLFWSSILLAISIKALSVVKEEEAGTGRRGVFKAPLIYSLTSLWLRLQVTEAASNLQTCRSLCLLN